ncbi:hypothetical protein A0H81_11050 [Grifola frondosa]|uniref:C2 domain-containing protein n=1 Tax=Grifola frondosa TaxID=5627 RepID=A0A1C7LW86_GRIFR|nr:hypothetical protein A0H81_11050 [Grifola frondosa]
MPSNEALYTCEITIQRAVNVPVGDIHNISSDPYVVATLCVNPNAKPPDTDSSARTIRYRTHTVRRTLTPEFNCRWLVSGVPASGFTLTLSLHDEDPLSHDDTLGKAWVQFPGDSLSLTEGWDSGSRECKVHKRHGGVRTRITTYAMKLATRGRVEHRTRIWVSVKVLGKAHDQHDHRVYTLGPHTFVQHFSPLAGYLVGTAKTPAAQSSSEHMSSSTFVANRLQLAGPVPASLRHRYVGFRPFVHAMFMTRGVRGILLHRALHKQHTAIYRWDKNTVWGVVEDGMDGCSDSTKVAGEALARQFLHMTAHGTRGRIFTYVITLDGQWRFTETGKEFAIDLLSKHTMHADVEREIAHDAEGPEGTEETEGVWYDDENAEPSSNPADYELVIDNDSGTYRPRTDLLPTLQQWLSSSENLGALARVTAVDGFDERLKAWKKRRAEVKTNVKKRRAMVGMK